jgi:hypothetical protein
MIAKERFSLSKTRVQVQKDLENGKSVHTVAETYGCGETQIARIKTHKDSILKDWDSGGRSDLKYVKKRKTTYEELNNSVGLVL